LAYLAIPALLLVCVLAVGIAIRNGRSRDAWAAVVLLVGANGTVQALKHPVLPFVSLPAGAGGNLSGHVAVAAATCLAVLFLAPRRPARFAIWCAWAFLSALSIAILLSRWHTLGEVLVPMFICGAWGVAAFAAVGARSRSRNSAGMPATQRAGQPGTPAVLACGGAVVLVLVGVAAWMGAVGAGTATGVAGVLAASFVLIAGAAAVTVGVVSAFLPVQAACTDVTADVRPKPVTGGPATAELHPVAEDNG